jgi:archaellum biogenesis ATPase FlaH
MTGKRTGRFVDLSTVEAKEIEWLMPPLIPYGMITIMEGDPGVGKSYLAMHIAAQISIGGSLPGVDKLERGRVLYLSAEDDPAYTIRPRIDAMGGDAKRIRIQADYLSLDEDGLQELFDEVRRHPPSLIIMDPLFAYVPGTQDMYRPNVIRSLLSQLRDIAEYGDTAVLIIRHLTKTKRDKAIYQGGGSMDVIGAARSAFLVAQHPDDPDLKIVAHVKHNIAPRGTSWVYELVQEVPDGVPVLKWIGPSDLTVEDLMGADDGDRKSALDEAIDFLREELKDGSKPVAEIEARGQARGIAKRTIDRARKEIGANAKKVKGHWILSLPGDK